MTDITYSIGVFIVILAAGCVVNLLERHYVVQLSGIAFFVLFAAFKAYQIVAIHDSISPSQLYQLLLPMFSGICACLISMVLGFFLFPSLRKRFKD
ncbi:hypothetical protein CDQ84_02710 [Clostridium thermosuccinogenes]|jgi:hypothetical protein|uniref:Uncharacterized protein n=1 Tax=Clostridium thermosuccinogenes TaxID=84032 RepID=A0A2K2FKR7_9CLOT|nr:hypothetical protein [Pseudoclostridium thermosuccinogenes]AUS95983.1 hypothetical protein CDO33_05735 [Pseudoclostridium thermosuccinogenes]PNT93294.1 hypothetical protein CDQ83_07195 [Pseudoclostridium thermosuccinogenes]PNT99372.1 hypothetical protein CDQ85_02710 [Pseudoclostridium thermosuccinogenes]PNU01059.1 hypothetical protein CDQ84_02710 [Pseudoclostridium thermosuccinogenes]